MSADPTPPTADRFWLLTGDVPAGPYTVAEVHAELAAGRATWQTPACPVGDGRWLPLVRTPGVGPETADPIDPSAGGPAATGDGGPAVPPVPDRPDDPAGPGGWRGLVGAAVSILGAVLVVGGAKWAATQFAARRPDAAAPKPLLKSILPPPPTAARPDPTQPYPGWALAPRPDPAARLVGSWRWDGGGSGYTSTFAFAADGGFTYYVAGDNPLLNLPVAQVEASGRWSVRDGTLFVEFTGGNDPAVTTLFRGRTGRSAVRFAGDDAVELTGVEGDAVTRRYVRIR